jgi:hypothetical protein
MLYSEVTGLTPYFISSGCSFSNSPSLYILSIGYKPMSTYYFWRYGVTGGYPITGMLFTGVGLDGEKYGLWLDTKAGIRDSIFYGGLGLELNRVVYRRLRLYLNTEVGKDTKDWRYGIGIGVYGTFRIGKD